MIFIFLVIQCSVSKFNKFCLKSPSKDKKVDLPSKILKQIDKGEIDEALKIIDKSLPESFMFDVIKHIRIPEKIDLDSFLEDLLNLIQKLVSVGFDVNGKNSDDLTPIFEAIFIQNELLDIKNELLSLQIIKSLILNDADINHQTYSPNSNFKGYTPLMLAITLGKKEVVSLLIEEEADLRLKECNGNTALMLAVQADCEFTVEMLLDTSYKDLNLNAINEDGENALIVSLDQGNKRLIEKIVDKCVSQDFNVRDKNNQTILSKVTDRSIAELLVNKMQSLDPNLLKKVLKQATSLLHHLLILDDIDLIEYFEEIFKQNNMNLFTNTRDVQGNYPLNFIKSAETFNTLLDKNFLKASDISLVNRNGDTLLTVLLPKSKSFITDLLRDEYQKFIKYILEDKKSIEKLGINKGDRYKYILQANMQGNNLLHMLAIRENYEFIKYLLNFFPQNERIHLASAITQPNGYGNSLIHILTYNRDKSFALSLVDFLSNQEIANLSKLQNCEQNSIFHMIAYTDNSHLLKKIIEHLSQEDIYYILNLKNSDGNTPLHILALSKNISMFKFLLSLISESQLIECLKAKNGALDTVSHIIAYRGEEKLLKELLSPLSKDQKIECLKATNGKNIKVIDIISESFLTDRGQLVKNIVIFLSWVQLKLVKIHLPVLKITYGEEDIIFLSVRDRISRVNSSTGEKKDLKSRSYFLQACFFDEHNMLKEIEEIGLDVNFNMLLDLSSVSLNLTNNSLSLSFNMSEADIADMSKRAFQASKNKIRVKSKSYTNNYLFVKNNLTGKYIKVAEDNIPIKSEKIIYLKKDSEKKDLIYLSK